MKTALKQLQDDRSETNRLFQLLFLNSYDLESFLDSELNYRNEIREIIASIDLLMSTIMEDA